MFFTYFVHCFAKLIYSVDSLSHLRVNAVHTHTHTHIHARTRTKHLLTHTGARAYLHMYDVKHHVI
jgi:hypothetical protein